METIEFDKQPIEKALEDWGAEIRSAGLCQQGEF